MYILRFLKQYLSIIAYYKSKRYPIPSQNYDLSNEHYICRLQINSRNTEIFMISKTCVIKRVLIIYSLWNHTASY